MRGSRIRNMHEVRDKRCARGGSYYLAARCRPKSFMRLLRKFAHTESLLQIHREIINEGREWMKKGEKRLVEASWGFCE